MSDKSAIEWTDATWNPITGCAIVSPGCRDCYAMRLAGTRLRNHPTRAGLTRETKVGPVWTGEVRLNEATLLQPLRWRRPRKIFVCAHGDLFAEGVPDAWIDRVFAVMALAPQHTFQVLTKRSVRMRAYLTKVDRENLIGGAAMRAAPVGRDISASRLTWCPATGHDFDGRWPLPNVWLGVSAEDQRRADERVPDLLATPAAVRFVSAEPLIGPIDFHKLPLEADGYRASALYGHEVAGAVGQCIEWVPPLDWIIVGGESGPTARAMHPAWARSIRDQCERAGTAFHFKQWGRWSADPTQGHPFGEWVPATASAQSCADVEFMAPLGKAVTGRMLDGRTHDAFPAGA